MNINLPPPTSPPNFGALFHVFPPGKKTKTSLQFSNDPPLSKFGQNVQLLPNIFHGDIELGDIIKLQSNKIPLKISPPLLVSSFELSNGGLYSYYIIKEVVIFSNL